MTPYHTCSNCKFFIPHQDTLEDDNHYQEYGMCMKQIVFENEDNQLLIQNAMTGLVLKYFCCCHHKPLYPD